MSIRAKLLFDECVGRPLVDELRRLSIGLDTEGVEIEHVLNLQFGSTNDDQWIPEIASEGWIIVTGDRGKRQKSGRGAKLPIVCAEYGVTHVVLSTAVNSFNTQRKFQAIVDHWEELIELRNATPGSTFQIQLVSSDRTQLKLKREPPQARRQQDLDLPEAD